MNCFEEYLVELLQGKIIINDKPVEVRKTFMPHSHLPCITLDLSAGVSTEYLYHDVSGSQEIMRYRRRSIINLNLWCNTEEERQNITSQILSCFYKERSNNYIYCTNYDNGLCKSGGNCKVSTVNTGRTAKGKCPDPDSYNYQSISDKYFLVPGEVIIEPPFDMDETDKHPPLLRSIFKCNALYEEPVLAHGITVEDFNIGDVNIEE